MNWICVKWARLVILSSTVWKFNASDGETGKNLYRFSVKFQKCLVSVPAYMPEGATTKSGPNKLRSVPLIKENDVELLGVMGAGSRVPVVWRIERLMVPLGLF